jgi:hypothetical protein
MGYCYLTPYPTRSPGIEYPSEKHSANTKPKFKFEITCSKNYLWSDRMSAMDESEREQMRDELALANAHIQQLRAEKTELLAQLRAASSSSSSTPTSTSSSSSSSAADAFDAPSWSDLQIARDSLSAATARASTLEADLGRTAAQLAEVRVRWGSQSDDMGGIR